MTDYILYLSKWRCGPTRLGGIHSNSNNFNSLGQGPTTFLNNYGYSCCLGQFAFQQGVSPDKLKDHTCPSNLADVLEKNYDVNMVVSESGYNAIDDFFNSELALKLIKINDGADITPIKIFKMKTLLLEYGHNLIVKL